MIKRAAIAVMMLASAAPAMAQDLVFSMQSTDSCLADRDGTYDLASCIGASARVCMEDTVGGQSTIGMSGCSDAELGNWDARLNKTYKQLMSTEKAADTEMTDSGFAAPKQAPALRDMQRAWITYRDTRCAYEAAQWGGGTGAGPAFVGCLMQLTGEQALFLRQMLDY